MRIAIIADLHGNLEATTAVFGEIDALTPDHVLCLGDLTGYNTQPDEVVDIIREREIPVIMGNHDAAVCGLEDPWFFRDAARKAVEWQLEHVRDDNKKWLAGMPDQIVFRRTCLAVHGSPGSRDDYIVDWIDAMRQMGALNGRDINICFFGHSHRASFFSERGAAEDVTAGSVHALRPVNRYFINPGAVGQPRDRDPRAAFGLFDMEKMTFEFRRVEYDIHACAKKVVKAGLPKELAHRLLKGK